MVLESFPQIILSIFIMQSLQITEWLNIGSCVISAISVLYGFSDFLVMMTHGFNEADVNKIPFKKSISALFSIIIDTFLRTLTIAYLMTFYKAYILFLPLSFFIMMCTIVCIRRKRWRLESAAYTIISFGCSAFEGQRDEDGNDDVLEQNFKLRPISKFAYATVLIGFAFVFGITTAPELLENNVYESNSTMGNFSFVPQNCTNLCFKNTTDKAQFEDYCSNIQEYINNDIHIAMWITIAVLFVLSFLEMALEACGKFMPYHKMLEPLPLQDSSNDEENSSQKRKISSEHEDENQVALSMLPKTSQENTLTGETLNEHNQVIPDDSDSISHTP